MSKFSGKCDLFDHIAGQGGWFNKEGQPVKFGEEGVGVYYSDEFLDFEAFKKKTGGVIHQHHKIKVDEYNQEFVKEHCKFFDYKKHVWQDPDKRCKCGFKEVITYTYIYYDKKYTLKELNKRGVYIETDIHFDTLLDLIPYYPYIVSCAACDGDKQYVVISKESFVDSEFKEHLQYGWISGVDYKKKLQEHYLEVCRDYFLYKLEERTKIIDIKNLVYAPEMIDDKVIEHYYLLTDTKIDYMHNIEFVWEDGKLHSHWTSPKVVNDNTIEISKEDVKNYLTEDIKNGTVKIKYVEKCEFPTKVN